MLEHYTRVFAQLVVTPFHYPELIWGIVPLYFGWFLNELTSTKPSFHTAIQTGFSFIWAAAHWTYQYRSDKGPPLTMNSLFAVNVMVTLLIFIIGALALYSGVRRRYPPGGSFLGHTRFSNYFMIMIFPIQSRCFDWSWDYVAAIVIFAVPAWLLMHFGLMPVRGKR